MNKRKLIREIVNRIEGKQLFFSEMRRVVHQANIGRAHKIVNYLYQRKERLPQECEYCENKQARFSIGVYDTPWQKEPTKRYYCCDEHSDKDLYERGDFDYFICNICNRILCGQNPGNGWHVQSRMLNDEQVCLKCYEEYILENGIDIYSFKNGYIEGMFFSHGNQEAIDKGYKEDNIFNNKHIRDQADVDRYCQTAILAIEAGHKVINAYESMAYGGSEGYVTMLVK